VLPLLATVLPLLATGIKTLAVAIKQNGVANAIETRYARVGKKGDKHWSIAVAVGNEKKVEK